MLCKRCLRALRCSEGIKCDECQSRFHLKCVNDSAKDLREGGDRGFQWKCAVCQNSVSKTHLENRQSKENLINTINSITEKFELVNKIQLPKLNNDLIHLKTMAEHIAKQNEDILRKIQDLENANKNHENRHHCRASRGYRKRSFNLTPKIGKSQANAEIDDHIPILPISDKSARYRMRRRSYVLHHMFHLLNRNMSKPKSPRRK